MQNSDNKKPTGKHVSSTGAQKPVIETDFLKDESHLYGDEADISIRKKKKQPAQKKKVSKRKETNLPFVKKKKKKAVRRKSRKPKRSLFEIMSATGEDSFFKPIYIFGKEIRFWPIILLVVVFLMVSGVMLNNSNIEAIDQKVTVVGLPEALEGYEIVVISDLNGKRFGDQQSLLLRTLNNLSYDAIFCLGDMVGEDGDPEPFWEFLDGLNRPERVYFICGDSDPGPFVEETRNITGTLSQMVLEDWIIGAIERGANYVDAPTCITVKDTNLWISPATMLNLQTIDTMEVWKEQTEQEEDGVLSGITEDYATLPMTSYRYQQIQRLYEAQRTIAATDLHIALAHEVPSDEFIYTSEEHDSSTERFLSEPELVLAGHYCGGVWRIPFLGALYVPDKSLDRNGWFPEDSKVKGLSVVGETQVYITGGLSTNADVPLMPFRLLNSPEITHLTLTSTLPENMLEIK